LEDVLCSVTTGGVAGADETGAGVASGPSTGTWDGPVDACSGGRVAGKSGRERLANQCHSRGAIDSSKATSRTTCAPTSAGINGRTTRNRGK
jgi:hypothetical protein